MAQLQKGQAYSSLGFRVDDRGIAYDLKTGNTLSKQDVDRRLQGTDYTNLAKHRGGVAGLYDRNKKWAVPTAEFVAGMIPGVGPLISAGIGAATGFDREGKGGIGFDFRKGATGAVSGYGMGSLGSATKSGLSTMFGGGSGAGAAPASAAPKPATVPAAAPPPAANAWPTIPGQEGVVGFGTPGYPVGLGTGNSINLAEQTASKLALPAPVVGGGVQMPKLGSNSVLNSARVNVPSLDTYAAKFPSVAHTLTAPESIPFPGADLPNIPPNTSTNRLLDLARNNQYLLGSMFSSVSNIGKDRAETEYTKAQTDALRQRMRLEEEARQIEQAKSDIFARLLAGGFYGRPTVTI